MQCLTLKEVQFSLLTLPSVTCLQSVQSSAPTLVFWEMSHCTTVSDLLHVLFAGMWMLGVSLLQQKEEQVSKFEELHLQAFTWSSYNQLF